MANLIPTNNNKTSGAIVKSDKFFASSSKKSSPSIKKPLNKDPKEDIILTIEKKVIKIDNLLKDSFALKKKQAEKARVSQEKKSFEKRESELEKKKPKTEKGIKLPSAPRMGFLDWIKNFITQTFLGFIAVRLIDFLPTLLKIYPVIISAGEFLIDVGGNLLNSLVSFVDWGYKAIDGTRQFIKNIGGEGWAQNFDKFAGAVDNLIEVAVIAALVTAGSGGGDGFGGKGVDPKKGFDAKGRRVGVDAQRRYAQRFGRDQFVDRFGRGNLGSLQGGARRGAFQQGARNAFVGLAGKGGAKSILKFVRPLTKRLPIIGGLLDFGLSVALGEDPGRAAFKAIGATLVGAVGAAIGSLAFGVGGIIGGIIGGIGGDALGGALYDMIFKNKKPTQKQGKVNKLAGGGAPMTRTSSSSTSTPRRTLKRKKAKRSLTFVPKKIKPGRSAGGEDKVQKVFPNPSKPKTSSKQPEWWDPFGIFTGGSNNTQQQQTQETKPKPKTQKPKVANPQEFLIKSNEVLGRTPNFGPIFTLALKTVLGDTPTWLDYLNVGRGLNAWTQGIFSAGSLGFSGGGEVDAKEFFQGEDYTNVIAKSVKDSVSKDVDRTIRNLKDELSLRPVGRDEMIQENIKGKEESSEGGDLETAGGAVAASELYKEIGANLEQWDIFRNSIALIESGGRYGIFGGSGNHYDGRYQMGQEAKEDGAKYSGVPYPGHSDDPNAHVRVSFRNNPQLQETLFTGFTIANHRFLMRNPKYKSASIERRLQILGYAHNQGMGNANTWLNTGVVGVDGFGTKGTKYTDLIAKNFRAKKSGGKMELAQGAVNVPGGGVRPISGTLKGGDGKFIQGNSGRSGGVHFHIGTNKPGDGSGVAAAGFRTIKHFLGKKTIHVGRSWEDIPANATDEQIMGYIRRGQAAHRKTELDLQIGGLDGRKNKVAFPLALKGMKYSATDGYGVSADIVGTNAFVGHGRYKPDGSLAPQQKLVLSSGSPDFYAFHGMNKVMTKDSLLKVHKGEYISVTDADSYRLVGNLLEDINDIENKSQLIARAPSIIEKLKTISNYTDDESENQVVFVEVPTPPEIVPIGSSGNTNIFVGGVNSDMASFDMEQKLSQIG